MTARTIPLSDPSLQASVKGLNVEGERYQRLRFTCPICPPEGMHDHVIAFKPGEPGKDGRIRSWTHVSGSTLADLTLVPSYLGTSPRAGGTCRLHIFVRGGQMQILGDSGFPA